LHGWIVLEDEAARGLLRGLKEAGDRSPGARMRGGKRCRKPALTGKLRCRTHGSLGGRPPGIQLRASQNDALQAGRARWVARMRAAKAQRGRSGGSLAASRPGVRHRGRRTKPLPARSGLSET
jgi:hypothetical protein